MSFLYFGGLSRSQPCKRLHTTYIGLGHMSDIFYQMIEVYIVIIFAIHCLVLKVSKKWPSQFPKAQVDIFKCLALFDQQSTTQRYSVFSSRRLKQFKTHFRIWYQRIF